METLSIKEEELNKALDEAFKKAGVNAYFGNGFKAGVQFALSYLNTIKKTVK